MRRVLLAFMLLASLLAMVAAASTTALAGVPNEPPVIVEVPVPDALQDEYYTFTFRANDPDHSSAELAWSDDSPLFDINATGGIAFNPKNADVGYHHFNITVEDPGGLTDTCGFTLFVANVNDPPVFHPIPPQTAREDEVWTLDASQYVEDPDLLLPPAYRDRITYRDDTTRLDTNLETGVVTWDAPTNDDAAHGDFFFKITVQDSKGRYAEQEVKISIINTNDPPKFGVISKQTLHQHSVFVYNVPFVDDDLNVPSANEELTFTNEPTELFTIDRATGRIMFTPVNEHVGVWEVTITVTDSAGASASKKVIFEVVNKNDHPELEYIPVQQLTAGVPYELQVVAHDPDLEPRLVDGLPADPNERLEYRTDSAIVRIDRFTGLISFTPDADDAHLGEFIVRITVMDRSSDTATEDVLYTFTPVNSPPTDLRILGLVDGQRVVVGTPCRLSCSVVDEDDGPTELDYAWYVGAALLARSSEAEWAPQEPGTVVVKLVVTDPHGGRAMATVTVDVRLPNAAPTDLGIAGLADGQSVRTDTDYTLTGSAKDDQDAPGDLAYQWRLDGSPLSQARQFVWRPEGEGPRVLSLEVTDSEGARGTVSISVVVVRVPPPPVVVSPPPGTIDKGDDLVVVIDVPEDELEPGSEYTVNVSSNVSGGLYSGGLDEGLELDLGRLPVGDHNITVSLSDGTYESSTSFEVTVEEAPMRVASPGPGALAAVAGLTAAVALRSAGHRGKERRVRL